MISNQRHLGLADAPHSMDQFTALRISRDEHRPVLTTGHRALIAVEAQAQRGVWSRVAQGAALVEEGT
jgi:hypothetical protein